MKRTDAEKLADKIFDMIEGNWPRGLVKSDLADLIAGFQWHEEPTEWIAIGDILREQNELQEIRKFFQDPCSND